MRATAIRLGALALVTAFIAVLPFTPAQAADEPNALASWVVKKIDLPVTHAAWVPQRNVVVATVSPKHASLGNELVELNPVTGQVLRHVFVGSQPTRVAVSDDGSTAYVALKGASAITKVGLDAFQVDYVIQLPQPSRDFLLAEDIAVAPGQPNVVVASLARTTGLPRYVGTWAFKDGVALANSVSSTPANRLEFTDPSTILGFNTEAIRGSFSQLTLDDAGLTLVPGERWSMFEGEFAGTSLFTQDGRQLDPTTFESISGYGVGGPVEPNAATDRVAYLSNDSLKVSLRLFVASTRESVGVRDLGAGFGETDLVAAGTGYVAIGTNGFFLIGPDVNATTPVTTPSPERAKVDLLVRSTAKLSTSDTVWDPVHNLLYAALKSDSSSFPNEVVAIDAATRRVTRHVAAGKDLLLAASSDFSTMYVASSKTNTFAKLDLNTFALGAPVPFGTIDGADTYLNDIDVVPGTTDTIAATLGSASSPGAVALYKDGTRLPSMVTTGNIPRSIHFGSPTDLYGTGVDGGPSNLRFPFSRMQVTETGLELVSWGVSMMPIAGSNFEFDANGVAWSTTGRAFLPQYPWVTASVDAAGPIEVTGDRTYVVSGSYLVEFDQLGRELGRLALEAGNGIGYTQQLTKFGDGLVATSTTDGLVFFTPARCDGQLATILGRATAIAGTAGDDVIVGSAAANRIEAGDGNDLICGGGGKDTLLGGNGNDRIVGTNDDEWIEGGAGNDTLFANGGTDYLFGDAGTDTLQGGAGNDRLTGGAGADDIDGGDGTDIYSVGTDNAPHTVTLDNTANDGLVVGDGGLREGDNVRSTNEIIIGSPGSDSMWAGASYAWFIGGAGNDFLIGGPTADRLDGGVGDDYIEGGAGDDLIVGGDGTDECVGGPGTNSVYLCEAAQAARNAVSFQQNAAHNGATEKASLGTTVKQLWTKDFGGDVGVPLIVGDRIFVPVSMDMEMKIYAFARSTGQQLWQATTPGQGFAGGLAYDNGRVFAVSYGREVRAFDAATGTLAWATTVTQTARPNVDFGAWGIVAANDLVYVPVGGQLLALSQSTGTVSWRADTNYGGGTMPPAVTDTAAYVTTGCDYPVGLDAKTGTPLWSWPASCQFGTSRNIPVAYDGRFYVRYHPFHVNDAYVYSPTGVKLTAFDSDYAPAFKNGSGIYISNDRVQAWSAQTGELLWSVNPGTTTVAAAPLIVGDRVYIERRNGQVTAYDLTTGASLGVVGSVGTAVPDYRANNPGFEYAQILSGMAAARGVLAVPAGSRLSVFG